MVFHISDKWKLMTFSFIRHLEREYRMISGTQISPVVNASGESVSVWLVPAIQHSAWPEEAGWVAVYQMSYL